MSSFPKLPLCYCIHIWSKNSNVSPNAQLEIDHPLRSQTRLTILSTSVKVLSLRYLSLLVLFDFNKDGDWYAKHELLVSLLRKDSLKTTDKPSLKLPSNSSPARGWNQTRQYLARPIHSTEGPREKESLPCTSLQAITLIVIDLGPC